MSEQNVLILDEQNIDDPEVRAMLQAFYSRSPMPIRDRLAMLNGDERELRTDKIRAAINRYYLGYGHASIADCATSTVFIEGVSMLAAKVIQDDPLYNGQECSTRYLDFSTQPFLTDSSGMDGEAYNVVEHSIQEGWRELYQQFLPKLQDWAFRTYGDEVLSVERKTKTPREGWDNLRRETCNAIAFDVARALLPCGAATSVAWTTTLRRLSDRCREMTVHPLAEVRQIGRTVYAELQMKYPNTFKARDFQDESNYEYHHFYNLEWNFTLDKVLKEGGRINSVWVPEGLSDAIIEGAIQDSLGHEQGLPREMFRRHADHLAYFNIGGLIDFGSFRDVQRHRYGLNKLPLVGAVKTEFNSYYSDILKSVDSDLFLKALSILQDVWGVAAHVSTVSRQYLFPMGLNVPTRMHWTLGQLRYVMSLRSKTSVHPTLRSWIHALYDNMVAEHPVFVKYLEVDRSPNYYQSDRGEQTIKALS